MMYNVKYINDLNKTAVKDLFNLSPLKDGLKN